MEKINKNGKTNIYAWTHTPFRYNLNEESHLQVSKLNFLIPENIELLFYLDLERKRFKSAAIESQNYVKFHLDVLQPKIESCHNSFSKEYTYNQMEKCLGLRISKIAKDNFENTFS